MKSASNGGVLKSSLQVLYVYVLLAAPQRFCNVLHTPDGYTCQVHLNESLFHTALPAAVPLNNGDFKGDPLAFGRLEDTSPEAAVRSRL